MERTSYEAVIEFDEESGEHFVRIPPQIMEMAGWEVADTLVWTVEEDDTIRLSKKDG